MKRLLLVTFVLMIGAPASAQDWGPYVFCSHPGGTGLCQLDLRTGQLARVGAGWGPEILPFALAYHPDGILYAVVENDADTVLATIDPTGGALTEVGSLGVSLSWYHFDLTVDTSGSLWALKYPSDLYSIDRATGQAALDCAGDPMVELVGLESRVGGMYTTPFVPHEPSPLGCGLVAVQSVDDMASVWLDHGPGGQLHATSRWCDPWDGFLCAGGLYRLDPLSGQWSTLYRWQTYHGAGDDAFWGLAFPPYQQPPLGEAIPILGPWAIALLCVAIAGAGKLVLRLRLG